MALPLNVFKTVTEVASTSATEIYTAPVGYTGVVLLAQAANVDSSSHDVTFSHKRGNTVTELGKEIAIPPNDTMSLVSVSYTHLRAHETLMNLVCRLLLEKKNHQIKL